MYRRGTHLPTGQPCQQWWHATSKNLALPFRQRPCQVTHDHTACDAYRMCRSSLQSAVSKNSHRLFWCNMQRGMHRDMQRGRVVMRLLLLPHHNQILNRRSVQSAHAGGAAVATKKHRATAPTGFEPRPHGASQPRNR